jgi:hypothetical protein
VIHLDQTALFMRGLILLREQSLETPMETPDLFAGRSDIERCRKRRRGTAGQKMPERTI